MSTQTTEQRTRTTCDECGLPYYADENDACPYCDTATADTAQERTGPQERTEAQEPTPAESGPSDPTESRRRSKAGGSSRSILDRLVAGVRDFFRK